MKFTQYFPCGKKSKPFKTLATAINNALDKTDYGVIEIRPDNVKNTITPFGWKHSGSTYVSVTSRGLANVKRAE